MRKKALSWVLTVSMVLSLFTALQITVNAQPPLYNCAIVDPGTGTVLNEYGTLDLALAAVTEGQTIGILLIVGISSKIKFSFSLISFITKSGRAISSLVNNAIWIDNSFIDITPSIGKNFYINPDYNVDFLIEI